MVLRQGEVASLNVRGIPFLIWKDGRAFIALSDHMEIVKEIEADSEQRVKKLCKIIEYDVEEIKEQKETIRLFLKELGGMFEQMYDFNREMISHSYHEKKKGVSRWRGQLGWRVKKR